MSICGIIRKNDGCLALPADPSTVSEYVADGTKRFGIPYRMLSYIAFRFHNLWGPLSRQERNNALLFRFALVCNFIIGLAVLSTGEPSPQVIPSGSKVLQLNPDTSNSSGDSGCIHEEYYSANAVWLERRFPHRKQGDMHLYIRQVVIVFGSAIAGLFLLLRSKIKPRKTYREIAGWDVSITTCTLNLIFAYAFGFVAVTNDWWFFFPDSFTGITWHLPNAHGRIPDHGYMILGDVVFYLMATLMGHLAVIYVFRTDKPVRQHKANAVGKFAWFLVVFIVGLFGLVFGSEVMQGMVLWLYIPFGLGAIVFYRYYSALQVWFVTILFVLCEFLWDVAARVMGVWIFPDSSTHPGLYIKEIVLFSAGGYPVTWQPEMTQMAFVSGMICLVFFFLARIFMGSGRPRVNEVNQFQHTGNGKRGETTGSRALRRTSARTDVTFPQENEPACGKTHVRRRRRQKLRIRK